MHSDYYCLNYWRLSIQITSVVRFRNTCSVRLFLLVHIERTRRLSVNTRSPNACRAQMRPWKRDTRYTATLNHAWVEQRNARSPSSSISFSAFFSGTNCAYLPLLTFIIERKLYRINLQFIIGLSLDRDYNSNNNSSAITIHIKFLLGQVARF